MMRCVQGLQQASRALPTTQRKSKIEANTSSIHIPKKKNLLIKKLTLSRCALSFPKSLATLWLIFTISHTNLHYKNAQVFDNHHRFQIITLMCNVFSHSVSRNIDHLFNQFVTRHSRKQLKHLRCSWHPITAFQSPRQFTPRKQRARPTPSCLLLLPSHNFSLSVGHRLDFSTLSQGPSPCSATSAHQS